MFLSILHISVANMRIMNYFVLQITKMFQNQGP